MAQSRGDRAPAEVSGTDGDVEAIAAAAFALPLGASIVVLHVLRLLEEATNAGYMQPLVAQAEVLTPAVETLRERGVETQALAVPGSPATIIFETAIANHAGLIALGPGRRASNLTALLLGDVAHEVVHPSGRPVLIGAARAVPDL